MKFAEALGELINTSLKAGITPAEVVFSLEMTKLGLANQLLKPAVPEPSPIIRSVDLEAGGPS